MYRINLSRIQLMYIELARVNIIKQSRDANLESLIVRYFGVLAVKESCS